jgi:hypothetical protein
MVVVRVVGRIRSRQSSGPGPFEPLPRRCVYPRRRSEGDVPENSPGEAGVFDAHADLLYTVVREHDLGNDRVIEDRFLPGMCTGGTDVRVVPIYLDAHTWAQPIGSLLVASGLIVLVFERRRDVSVTGVLGGTHG